MATSGREPDRTSRDELSFLNAGDEAADVRLTVYYIDREPVGPYRLTVPARRMLPVRINDLIDPQAVPLETPYACIVESSVPVVVQFTRVDTGNAENAVATAMAFSPD